MATKDRKYLKKSKIDHDATEIRSNKTDNYAPFRPPMKDRCFYFKKRVEIRGGDIAWFAWECYGLNEGMALSCLRTATDRYNFIKTDEGDYKKISKEFKKSGRRIQNII